MVALVYYASVLRVEAAPAGVDAPVLVLSLVVSAVKLDSIALPT